MCLCAVMMTLSLLSETVVSNVVVGVYVPRRKIGRQLHHSPTALNHSSVLDLRHDTWYRFTRSDSLWHLAVLLLGCITTWNLLLCARAEIKTSPEYAILPWRGSVTIECSTTANDTEAFQWVHGYLKTHKMYADYRRKNTSRLFLPNFTEPNQGAYECVRWVRTSPRGHNFTPKESVYAWLLLERLPITCECKNVTDERQSVAIICHFGDVRTNQVPQWLTSTGVIPWHDPPFSQVHYGVDGSSYRTRFLRRPVKGHLSYRQITKPDNWTTDSPHRNYVYQLPILNPPMDTSIDPEMDNVSVPIDWFGRVRVQEAYTILVVEPPILERTFFAIRFGGCHKQFYLDEDQRSRNLPTSFSMGRRPQQVAAIWFSAVLAALALLK